MACCWQWTPTCVQRSGTTDSVGFDGEAASKHAGGEPGGTPAQGHDTLGLWSVCRTRRVVYGGTRRRSSLPLSAAATDSLLRGPADQRTKESSSLRHRIVHCPCAPPLASDRGACDRRHAIGTANKKQRPGVRSIVFIPHPTPLRKHGHGPKKPRQNSGSTPTPCLDKTVPACGTHDGKHT